MKVLHIAAADGHGGAHRAAYRLHQALRSAGVASSMIVGQRHGQDPDVSEPEGPVGKLMALASPRIDRLPVSFYRKRTPSAFSPAWFSTGAAAAAARDVDADLVHLHWITGGLLRPRDLSRLRVPVVWTLHDMWPMTGGCHYTLDCLGFEERCGHCPQLGSNRALDLSRFGHARKRHAYGNMERLHLVPSSRWLADQLTHSSLLGGYPYTVLPNPIDCGVFKPVDAHEARSLLGLSSETPIVLFAGVGAVANPVKGFTNLVNALATLGDRSIELVILGSAPAGQVSRLPVTTRHLGHLSDDVSLRLAYSAADVVVVPSVQDNLPLVAVEALACGTPVVGFDGTGLADIVGHLEWGYLADRGDAHDLANGIRWVLDHRDPSSLRRAARDAATLRFDSGKVAARYITLYETLLGRRAPAP